MTEDGDQRSASRGEDGETERIKNLVRETFPPTGGEAEPDRDLWPAMLQRMNSESAHGATSVPWFDWALAGGVMGFVASAPQMIPVILYYL
jgi:hypothetical protein